jgi:hypothetical protein
VTARHEEICGLIMHWSVPITSAEFIQTVQVMRVSEVNYTPSFTGSMALRELGQDKKPSGKKMIGQKYS